MQAILVCEAGVKDKAVGCVMVKFRVAVHPILSVTVTVYVPAESPVAIEPVPPAGDQL